MNLKKLQLKKSPRGSLIIQLMVSIGIIVALALISIPTLKQYQPSVKINGAAKMLISDLRYAQQMTVTEQAVYYLEMDQINSSYAIYKQSDPSTPVKTVALDPEISFQSITNLTNNRVVYNSFGAVSEAGEITLANSAGGAETISVRPSGYIQWL